jgi:hypothetical protein
MSGKRHRFPAFYDALENPGLGAWWVLEWNRELVSFRAVLEVDHEGEEPCQEEQDWSFEDDCYPVDEPPLAVIGERVGQYMQLEQLETAMAREEDRVELPRELAVQLATDRDRHLESLTRAEQEALIARVRAEAG